VVALTLLEALLLMATRVAVGSVTGAVALTETKKVCDAPVPVGPVLEVVALTDIEKVCDAPVPVGPTWEAVAFAVMGAEWVCVARKIVPLVVSGHNEVNVV